jgi:hypothetical protein
MTRLLEVFQQAEKVDQEFVREILEQHGTTHEEAMYDPIVLHEVKNTTDEIYEQLGISKEEITEFLNAKIMGLILSGFPVALAVSLANEYLVSIRTGVIYSRMKAEELEKIVRGDQENETETTETPEPPTEA